MCQGMLSRENSFTQGLASGGISTPGGFQPRGDVAPGAWFGWAMVGLDPRVLFQPEGFHDLEEAGRGEGEEQSCQARAEALSLFSLFLSIKAAAGLMGQD